MLPGPTDFILHDGVAFIRYHLRICRMIFCELPYDSPGF